MIGEKFIERKIDGNKVIKVSEWKEFDYDYSDIAQDINDHITDEPENLFNNYGIACDWDNDFVWLDCDACIDGINDYISALDADELEDYEWLTNYLPMLEKAKGFTIYFDSKKEDYEDKI